MLFGGLSVSDESTDGQDVPRRGCGLVDSAGASSTSRRRRGERGGAVVYERGGEVCIVQSGYQCRHAEETGEGAREREGCGDERTGG